MIPVVPQAGPVGRDRGSTSTLPTKATVATFLLTPFHNTHSLRASPFQFRNVYQTIYEVVSVSHNCRLPFPLISFIVLINQISRPPALSSEYRWVWTNDSCLKKYECNSISKLQIQVVTYVFELSAGNCHR
jgi:hypothetical protein